MTTCLAPRCASGTFLEVLGFLPPQQPALGVVLCLQHVAAAASPVRRAPERPDLRGRCWGDALTCPNPRVTVNPHGGWCEQHAPWHAEPRPFVPRGLEDERLEPDVLEAAVTVMRTFPGSTIAGTGRAYSLPEDAFGPQLVIDRGGRKPAPWIPPVVAARNATVDEVPTGARSMAKAAEEAGWSCTTRYARGWMPNYRAEISTPNGVMPGVKGVVESVVVRAWRGPLFVVGSWHGGKFAKGWLQCGRALPTQLAARQITAVLRSAA